MEELSMSNVKVAVIGLGPAGLVALKTLREEGFDAVGFDRRDRVGGLWAYDPNTSYTSVIPETVTNVSKFISGFSDFPITKEYPIYLNGADVARYFQTYVQHFQLQPHCRFGTTISKVIRSDTGLGWNIHMKNENGNSILQFDKVVFGSGFNTIPKYPPMPGKDLFKGTIIHGQQYRRPEAFSGKRVMVVGLGNTACETALNLTAHCTKVYQSYRRGRVIVSRYNEDGTAIDATLSWPILQTKYFLDYWMPWIIRPLVDKYVLNQMTNDVARFEPSEVPAKERSRRAHTKVREWRLYPFRSLAHQNPVVQDRFIPALNEGQITPVQGFKEFIGDREVRLVDDTVVEVDVVIFCTGYWTDFSILPELVMNGAGFMPQVTVDALGDSPEPDLPRLYKMIFPPKFASSIAFLSWMAPQENVWSGCELAAMAVSQIWAAEHWRPYTSRYKPATLPSLQEMEQDVDQYHRWWRENWREDHSMHPGFVQAHTLFRFLHEKAGTGMYTLSDHLFTGRGWSLWWNDKDLYTWLSNGPMNSYAWRLLNTNPERIPGCGRKAWPGAREAIHNAYLECQAHRKDAANPRGK